MFKISTEIDDIYLSDFNHDDDYENFKYHDDEYYDDDENFENLNLDAEREDLDEEREDPEEEKKEEDTSTSLIFRTKRMSTVWQFFDKRTLEHLGLPVYKKCGSKFSTETGISSLKRHMKN